jgi:glycosyltransferase involved in cell wall biosynthesis
LFISSLNTRYPLELTLSSLLKCTRYPDYRLWIADNGSTDGSLEYLQTLRDTLPLRLIQSPRPKSHSQWLDEVFRTVETPYWVAVDSDMLFLGRDWLCDLVRVMEAEPETYLLAAERRKPVRGYVEPVSSEVVDMGEAPSTWLFAVRTSLRERLHSSFAFVATTDPNTAVKQCYDTGGRLLSDMREKNLAYRTMPWWFTRKYYHFGSLSWAPGGNAPGDYLRFKQYQLHDIQRRLRRARAAEGPLPVAGGIATRPMDARLPSSEARENR